ncbi:MAG: serine hydrolase domain-containing protein [Armatimonas sp.]
MITALLARPTPGRKEDPIDTANLPYQKKVTELAEAWRARYHLPGAWCAYIRDGKVAALVATGFKNLETKAEASVTDRLGVGSVTKVFTGSLIAFFVADGTLKYETKIGDVFPDLKREFPNSPIVQATLRQLLNHTSGMPKDFTLTSSPPTATGYRLSILKRALALTDLPSPGTRYEYSNLAFDIAVAMVERLTGKSYESWLLGDLGKKIGLTSPIMSDGHVNAETPVVPYYLTGGHISPGRSEAPRGAKHRGQFAAGGGCYANLSDQCRFALFTMNNSASLPPAVYSEITHPIPDYPKTGIDKGQVVTAPKTTGAGWEYGLTTDLIKGGVTGRGEAARVRLNVSSKRAFLVYINAFPASASPSLTSMVDSDIAPFMRP